MRRVVRLLALAVVCLASAPSAVSAAESPHTLPGFEYVYPAPGTGLHRPHIGLIVRPGGRIRTSSIPPASALAVSGSVSGPHEGRIRVSDDGETILFLPQIPFYLGETVTCTIAPGIETERGGPLPGATFEFRIMGPNLAPPASEFTWEDEWGGTPLRGPAFAPGSETSDDFPRMVTAVRGATAPGDLFLSDFSFTDPTYRSTLMIVRNDGSPVFTRRLDGRAFDFKMQPDGRLTYFDTSRNHYMALDPSFAIVDSFACGGGYVTDIHDLRLLPNGHALLISYDAQVVDMSAVVPGGDPHAVVTAVVVQELDREKDVVFQWRSWDHFQITDAVNVDLTAKGIDYVHANSIDPDLDGNLLLSCRHMDEVTKIDRRTGGVRWRMGGRNNEFTFVNDPIRFAHQHAVRRLPDGHILMFDNGNFRVPFFSRAVEYEVDEARKVATLVWQHRDTPDVGSFALGYAQRLPNGNTLIGWGAYPRTVTEVTPEGVAVFDGSLPTPLYSYRVTREEWPPVLGATVALEPRVLGASSRGRWVTATITSDRFDLEAIDPGAVTIAGDLVADRTWAIRTAGPEGLASLRVRFDRASLLARLHPGLNEVEITGPLETGARFRDRVEVRVVGGPKGGSNRLRVVSVPGALPARISIGIPGGRLRLRAFDVNGRLVRAWTASADREGNVTWNGRGADGARVAAGLYFLRAPDRPRATAARVLIAR